MVGFKREILTLDSSSTTFVPKLHKNSLDTPKKAAMTFLLTLCLGLNSNTNSNPAGQSSSNFEYGTSSSRTVSVSSFPQHSSVATASRFSTVFGLGSRGQKPVNGPISHFGMVSTGRTLPLPLPLSYTWHDSTSAESGSRSRSVSVSVRRGLVRDTEMGAGAVLKGGEAGRDRSISVHRTSAPTSAPISENHRKSSIGGWRVERDNEEVQGSIGAKLFSADALLERDVRGKERERERDEASQLEQREKQKEKEKERLIQNRMVHYGVYCGPGPADAFSGNTHTHMHHTAQCNAIRYNTVQPIYAIKYTTPQMHRTPHHISITPYTHKHA